MNFILCCSLVAHTSLYNIRLRRDVKNRELYLKGETEMKQDFLKALDKVVAMMKDRCDDKNLVELVVKKAATAPR